MPEVTSTQYKWLRAVAKGEFTGLHCDQVFVGATQLLLMYCAAQYISSSTAWQAWLHLP